MHATRSAHLTLLDLIVQLKLVWECKTMKLFIIHFSPTSYYYFLPRIEIFISALHSQISSVYIHLLMREPKYHTHIHTTNILTTCSSLNLRDQVSDPYTKTCEITVTSFRAISETTWTVSMLKLNEMIHLIQIMIYSIAPGFRRSLRRWSQHNQ
jgi:hypothetical protein